MKLLQITIESGDLTASSRKQQRALSVRPTIREIAALAGVSIATVSRVVNGSGYVAEQTRDAVEEVIREHGYTANRAARAPLAADAPA